MPGASDSVLHQPQPVSAWGLQKPAFNLMSDNMPASLGTRLSPLLAGGFFRPLTRASAAVYVDCADRLAEAADEGGQIPHADARVLIRDVLLQHPDVQLEEDEGGQFRDLNQRASQFFNKLIEVHWIEPRRISLDEHYVLIAPALRQLLRLLRELAENRPAELKDFAATLRSLCRDLLNEGAMDPNKLGPEEMRQTVKDLLERTSRASDQMHAVETLILQHAMAQRTSSSAQETLQRFLVEFHTGEHMVCYDALQEAGLLPRLNQARSVAQEALYDPFTKQRLAEGLAKHLDIDDTAAYVEAERWLVRLERQLAAIPVRQRLIDGRMAEFSRLSAARYTYQTEMRGRHPGQVKAYLDEASNLHSGKSFADLAGEPGMNLLSPVAEIFWGTDSLSRPRRQRPPVNLGFEQPSSGTDSEAATDEIRRRNLNVLTPQRASRFVERHLPAKGTVVSTEQLRVLQEDDLLDLLAVLAFDRGPAGASRHPVRWRVRPMRADFGMEPDRIQRDAGAGRLVERFTLERIS
jgi:hemerythrin-like domain-containing protein